MASYTCESCKYSTTRNWLYKDHITSKKHIAMQTSETSDAFRHVCTYCSKKYASTTGLKKHNIKCAARIKHEEEIRIKLDKDREQVEMIVRLERENNELIHQLTKEKEHNELINRVMEEVNQLKSKFALQLMKDDCAMITEGTPNIIDVANMDHSAITNNSHNVTYRDINNNTSIHQNVHVYLNTHCHDTPSINEFIDNIQFSKEEIDQIVRAHQGEQIHKALIRVFKSKLQDVPFQQRPLHCVKPAMSTSTCPGESSLFVMDDQEWKEENAGKTATQIRDVEVYDDDTDMEDAPPEEKTGEIKTPLNKATAKFTRKMHDVCEELYSDKDEQSKAEGVMMKMRKCSTIGDLVESLENMPGITLDTSQIDQEA